MRGKQSSARQEEEKRINSGATRLSRWSLFPVFDLRCLPRSHRLWKNGGELEFLEDERVNVGIVSVTSRFAFDSGAHWQSLHVGSSAYL